MNKLLTPEFLKTPTGMLITLCAFISTSIAVICAFFLISTSIDFLIQAFDPEYTRATISISQLVQHSIFITKAALIGFPFFLLMNTIEVPNFLKRYF